MNLNRSRVALIYDRVNTPYGGAENVLLALHKLYPNAPLYTLVYDQNKAEWAKNFTVIPSFVQKIPFANKMHRYFAWLAPFAFESFDLSAYDLIISVTSAEAKGVITSADQTHLCYLLTPPRYLYQDRKKELKANALLSLPLINFFANKLLDYLTWWDQAAINRPDLIIPISHAVKLRVKKYYHLETEAVIYPPITLTEKNLPPQNLNPSLTADLVNSSYYLVISRLVPYKRVDLAIKACSRLNKKLIIVGEGPEFSKLKKLASDNVVFLGSVSQEKLQMLISNSIAVIMPQIEDFGITALEANFFGRPVIVNKSSGVAELITDKIHGVHFEQQSTEEIITAINTIEKIKFNTKLLKQNASKYNENSFIKTWETKYVQK